MLPSKRTVKKALNAEKGAFCMSRKNKVSSELKKNARTVPAGAFRRPTGLQGLAPRPEIGPESHAMLQSSPGGQCPPLHSLHLFRFPPPYQQCYGDNRDDGFADRKGEPDAGQREKGREGEGSRDDDDDTAQQRDRLCRAGLLD